MITSAQKRAIRDSFPSISALTGPVMALFYGRLFELAPEVRPLFKQDLTMQGRQVIELLSILVGDLDGLEQKESILRALGQRHAGYGVRPEHYDTAATALVWAFGVALEDEFSPELKAAWRTLIDSVSAVMKDGAAEVTAP